MNNTQPMPSTRLFDGSYEVIGTSRCAIIRMNRNCDWELKVDGEVVTTAKTKRDLLIYCQEHPEI